MTNSDDIVDVAIIGAGPVGLFAVFECGMLSLKCHVIDTLPEIGGQCTALYPEKPIYDIPAHPEIAAEDLIAKLETQAAPFKAKYTLNQKIVSISNKDDIWNLITDHDNVIRSKTIIIASGAGAFGPNKPPLEGIDEYESTSIFYMVRQKDDFKDKIIMIAGGGDSAVDWTLSLAPITKHIHLVHRRDKFRAAPESLKKLKELEVEGLVTIETPCQLSALNGSDGELESVELKNSDGTLKDVKVDALLPFYGLSMELGPIAEWGLNLDHNHIEIEPTTAKTNKQNIYAVGDIASYKNKKKLILTGFSEAAFAAHDIYDVLNPDQPLHFEYSTTKGVPNV